MQVNIEISELINRGALFVVNHSGGKDSQAMFIKLREIVPADQLLVVHADLPKADWAGTWEHIVENVAPLAPVKATAVKTFMDMVEHRGMWPSPQYRQCTSDLKRGPIEKTIRQHLKSNPQFAGLVVNCMGLRAEESSARAKQQAFKLNARNSKAGREWYDWLPIHDMLVGEVFDTIRAAGQEPHWAYGKGMTRLSCMFCIMASQADLTRAAELNPETYSEYVAMEKKIDHSFAMPVDGERRFLEDITGIKVETEEVDLLAIPDFLRRAC